MMFCKSVFFIVAILLSASAYAQVSFTEFDIHTNTVGAAGLYCCDLDDDDDMDILVAINEGDAIGWFENDGSNPPLFTRHIIASGMSAAHSVHANDIDNDGDLDVLGTTYGSSIYWFRNDGGSPLEWTRFRIVSGFTQAHEVYSVDIDDDGDIDVLGASSSLDRVTLWYNEGGDPIEWTAQIIDNSCEMAKSVSAADFNGDGRMDIVSAAIESGDIYWYKNEIGIPQISWTPYAVDLSFAGAHFVHPVDIDQDGHIDIVAAGYLNNQVAWWQNDGADPPSWTRRNIEYNVNDACICKTADIDNDGHLDVVATEQGSFTVSWFRNNGQDPIGWTTYDITTDFLRPWPLDLADLDNDGDIDVVSASSYNGSDEVKWWRNDGQGNFVVNNPTHIQDFSLKAYPNPFNSQVNIGFKLDVASDVEINIYDIQGRLVRSLVSRNHQAGYYNSFWNGKNYNNEEVSSGIYIIQIINSLDIQSKKILKIN